MQKGKKKYNSIEPIGKLNMHTYLGDQDGCGFIRVITPALILNQFKYKKMSFESSYNSYFINDINFYNSISILKFQRSMTENQLYCISKSLEFSSISGRFGVLYEVDDLLTNDIPDTNFAAKYYKEAWPIIKQMLSIVHGLTVSTEELKNELLPYNKNIQVIKNRLPSFLWEQQDPYKKQENDKIRILWAGSQNHFSIKESGGDFNSELLKFIQKTSNEYKWVFVGAMPNELKNNSDIEFHSWQKIVNFGKFLKNLNCDMGIAPLENCVFNNCKSNIKCLEYASLGLPGIFSNAAPYKNMNFSSNDKFIDNIEYLTHLNKEDRLHYWKKDYNKLKNDIYWDDMSIKEYMNSHLKLFDKCLN